MRTFDSGAVRDSNTGKGRCDLLPLDVICDVVNDDVLEQIHKFKEDGDYNHLIELLKNELKDTIYDDLLGISDRFEMGAIKYGDENWKKGIPASVYIDSGIRHYLKYKRVDEDEPHRIAYMWNMLCCIWICKHNPDMNVYAVKYKSKEDVILNRDVTYYMSKGMERKAAEYFASGIKNIVSINPNKDFTLTLNYDDGSTRLYDCNPFLLKDTVFEPFMEWDNFKRVYSSSDGRKVCWDVAPEVDSNEVWDNVVDLCADAVYIDSISYEGESNE